MKDRVAFFFALIVFATMTHPSRRRRGRLVEARIWRPLTERLRRSSVG